ncbi:MAG TPA: glycoside hydrolase family 127 protein [Arachnia sp.]|nr:glycoside hydrolase family 127 protein [Arachnia sp.]HMT87011.1 glycoside hydrolase family 127 protein [Arachnia sp.]
MTLSTFASRPLSRRGVLLGTALGTGSIAVAALSTKVGYAAPPTPGATAASVPVTYPSGWNVRPFPLSDVTLDPGSVFERAKLNMLELARRYPLENLLVIFRLQAGLLTKTQAQATPPAGGWEGWPDRGIDAAIEQRWGPEYVRGTNKSGASGLLRGHYTGHMLSMLALAYASTGDEAIRTRAAYLVDELEKCRAAMADGGSGVAYSHPGFLSAYGEWQFSALEEFAPYGEIWAPYYTLAKILAGLVELYQHCGLVAALNLAQGIGHWVYGRLSKCSVEQLQRMWSIYIGGEFGGMNEALYDLWVVSEGQDDPFEQPREEFLAAAKLFDQDRLIASTTANTDPLTDLHANQHIPQFVGYAKLGAAGIRPRADIPQHDYQETVKNFFGMIKPGRMYAHGGTGEGEMWGPPNTVAGDIGSRNAESCAAYNMLKVSRSLYFAEPDVEYMDYYERTLLNHILGGRARDLDNTTRQGTALTPGNCYMYPVHPAALKEYGNGNIGTCCGGTALESHVKYQDTIWTHSKDDSAVQVNLFMPSTLTWSSKGVTLRQETAYPQDTKTTITVASGSAAFAIKVRIPAWTIGATVAINGGASAAVPSGAYYSTGSRTWSAGDKVEVVIPMHLRTESTIDRPDIQSLFYGPTVLNALNSAKTYLNFSFYPRLGLDGTIRHGFTQTGDGKTKELAFTIDGIGFEPAWNGNNSPYHMYFTRTEPTVAFAGSDSGVTNPTRIVTRDGRETTVTLLDEIWAGAPFATRSEFLSAVQSVTLDWQTAGQLSARNRQSILLAAGKARV